MLIWNKLEQRLPYSTSWNSFELSYFLNDANEIIADGNDRNVKWSIRRFNSSLCHFFSMTKSHNEMVSPRPFGSVGLRNALMFISTLDDWNKSSGSVVCWMD